MKKWIPLFALLLISAVLFAACGGSDPSIPDASSIAASQGEPIWALVEEQGPLGTYTYTDYKLDRNGNVLSYSYGENGSPTHKVTQTFFENGLLESKLDESSYGYDLLYCTYDEKGVLIEEEWESDFSVQNGKDFVYTYEYDENGRAISRHSEAQHAEYVMDETYEYNAKGQLIKRTEKSETSAYEITLTYDENGNLAREQSVNLDTGSVNDTYYTCEIIGHKAIAEDAK